MTLKNLMHRTLAKLNTLFGLRLVASVFSLFVVTLLLAIAGFLFFNSAAPTHLTMLSGEEGSSYRKTAEKYKKLLAKQGISVTILSSEGSSDNLKKLADPKFRVDVGFVQGGGVGDTNIEHLVSLGSVSYQPLMIFYRGKSKKLLTDFKKMRLDIGEEGSGTRTLALALLKANGFDMQTDVQLVHAQPADLIASLLENRTDALFLMGDSVSSDIMRKLMHNPDIHLFNFVQADGYTRRIKYLSKLALPQGALDLGKNLPTEDTHLIAPTVELIARDSLHPALNDMLLEAAKEIHGGAGLFRKHGEFPALMEHEIPVSQDARNYYQSGQSFLYETFPFWLASLMNRIAAVFVPIILLLIPGLKIAPALYRWRMQSRIYPWYGTLLEIDREASHPLDDKQRAELLNRLNHIEHAVKKITIPATFADLFYTLVGHIQLVRERILAGQKSGI